MNFLITEIGNVDLTIRKEENKPHMLQLHEYYSLAQQIVKKFASRNVRHVLLNSEDAMNYIAYRLMMGDWAYDATRTTLKTYRGFCGKQAIKDCFNIWKSTHKALSNSINDNTDKEDEHNIGDLIPDTKNKSPLESIIEIEQGQINSKKLRDMIDALPGKQRNFIILYYFKNMTMLEIAQKYSYSQEWVRLVINKGLNSLRKTWEAST